MTAKIRKKCETESEKQKKLFFRFFSFGGGKSFQQCRDGSKEDDVTSTGRCGGDRPCGILLGSYEKKHR